MLLRSFEGGANAPSRLTTICPDRGCASVSLMGYPPCEGATPKTALHRFIGDSNDNVFYGLAEVGRDDRQTEFIGLDGEHYHVTGDAVEYDGDRCDFEFGESEQPYVGGLTVTGDKIGTDILLGIEFIKFNDALVATSNTL